MKNKIGILLIALLVSTQVYAQEKTTETFSDAEKTFNLVMSKLLDKYIDKDVTREELFKAATAGMLSSLNSGDETWNKLLSPRDLKEMEIDLSGKVTGIGASIKWDDHNGYGLILSAIPGSAAEKAGLKTDDQILSVDGRKFKGKKLIDLVTAIRGEVGKSVELRVLREDKILTLNIKRETISWSPVELEKVNSTTALLSIGFFSEQTPQLVEEKLGEINKNHTRKLIVDLRDNDGGGFDQAVRVAGLFLPEDSTIASTKDRDGHVENFHSHKSLLNKDVQVIVLTNKGTFCGAELLAAALKEERNAKSVGETTFGKWNAQSVESLPNHFAVKYTVKEFLDPQGNSYQGVGIKPDLEVSLPKDTDVKELRSKLDISKRVGTDLQLKAALELIKAA